MSTATSVAEEAASMVPFPSTWKASLNHWWSANSTDGYTAQSALIKRGLEGTGIQLLDYTDASSTSIGQSNSSTASSSSSTTQAGQKVAKLRKIELGGGKDRVLNVLEVGEPVRKPGEHTILVLHGYGGAFGFYWQNLKILCSYPNTRIYFMDMLGMGLSGRPSFPSIKIKGDATSTANIHSRVQQAESFFLDSFEDFAKHEKLSSFTMVGHSLGGYLSTAYALQYPKRVNKLVLVSPVGVPKSPYHNDEEEEAKIGDARGELDREISRSQEETTSGKASSSPSKATKSDRPTQPTTWWTRAWEYNISPFSIVRLSSFAGPKLVSRYAQRRFALFEAPVQKELFSYLYSVYGQKGSGEYCLAHLLSPGAFARWPLIQRMKQLDPNLPVSFIYGDSDWMDKKGGREASEMVKSRQEASDLVKKRTEVYINPHAGHWVFLDNPGGFNKIMSGIMQDAIKDNAQ